MEFFEFLLQSAERAGRSSSFNLANVFQFSMDERLQCKDCNCAGYKTATYAGLSLPVLEKYHHVTNEMKHITPLEECLDEYFREEMLQFNCPVCKTRQFAGKSLGMRSFPPVLVMHMKKFLVENWVPRKLDIEIVVPDRLDMKRWVQQRNDQGETLFPTDADDVAAMTPPAFVPDQAALEQLLSTGFPPARCERALRETNNSGAEAAMEWLLMHMDEPGALTF